MKIAIDARWIFPEISGIGAYTRELITQLTKIDKENEYFLIFSDKKLADQLTKNIGNSLPDNFMVLLVPYSIFSIKNQFQLPKKLKKLQIDIFHSPNYIIPFLTFPRNKTGKIKCITTIHDVIPMIFPHHAPKSLKSKMFWLYKILMREVAKRTDTIITDSQSSANDIIKHLKIPATSQSKIKIIFCGVTKEYKPPATDSHKTSEYRKILYVGRSDPYKNLIVLIKAFAKASLKLTAPAKLIIAGSPDPRYPEGPALAKELNIEDNIQWTGYLSDKDLVRTFQEADLLVHPSQYEGFGLPVLEAMACGTPVISSNASSLPEVAGDAAILVNPNDINAYAENIIKVLNNSELADKLSKKGLEQASKFSWEKNAQATLTIYTDTNLQTVKNIN